tara:strand:+ start:244 stop:543 length:300 start_codon:yes stop_codon:yes gene_type:complete
MFKKDIKKQFEKQLIQYGLKNNYIEKEKDGTLKFVGSKNKYSVESRLAKYELKWNQLVKEIEQDDILINSIEGNHVAGILIQIKKDIEQYLEENKNGNS